MIASKDDLELYIAPDATALHAAVCRLYEVAKQRLQSSDRERVDSDTGEVVERRYRLTFGEDRTPLTLKQRGFLHAAVFPQIAEQVTMPDGTRYAWQVWKEHFRARFLPDKWVLTAVPKWDAKKCRLVQPKRKTPRRVRVSTEDLSVKQYSEHIDRVIDTAVSELGVVFEFNEREREEVRYRAPKRKVKARPPEDATAADRGVALEREAVPA